MSEAGLGSYRRRVLRGVGWKVATSVVSQVTRLVVALTLARLLAPHDYGVAGMVLVLSGLVAIFADLALGSALVQRKTLTDADTSTVFWTSVCGGLVFTVLGIAVAGPVAAFFHQPAGNDHGLLGIAGIIFHIKHKLLTIDAAARIDVGHGLGRTPAELFAKCCILAFHRAYRCNEDFGGYGCIQETEQGECQYDLCELRHEFYFRVLFSPSQALGT